MLAPLQEIRADRLYSSRIWIWCVIFSWTDALPKMIGRQNGQKITLKLIVFVQLGQFTYSYIVYHNQLFGPIVL